MNGRSSRHAEAKRIFLDACELDATDRAAFLERECGLDRELQAEVEAMLDFDAGGSALLSEPPPRMPARIGPYVIEGVLGRGGMGIVYRARQLQPRRTVALKVVVPELATDAILRRFANEAQFLGGLHHDGIAQVYEAGTADTDRGQQPWFAMELVEGKPITEWAEQRDLDARAKLELVAKVADAVHYAHGCGIVHRDLKPDNVLVNAAGQPKILDFGIARALDPGLRTSTTLTHAGQVVGTLAYMSPEQAEGAPSDTGPASDVWALGVITYELLAGRLPIDVRGKSMAEAARLIRDAEPLPLGRRDRTLRGDITIVARKALEKEPGRRYETAADFAADLRRVCRFEPIAARAPTTLYQLRQFARRNRGLTVGLATTALALIAGTVLSMMFAIRASDAAEEERVAATEARAVAGVLERLFFEQSPAFLRGKPRPKKSMLDDAVERIRSELADQPRVQTRLMRRIARSYIGLGRLDDARALLDEARAIGAGKIGERTLGVARTIYMIGSIHVARGDADGAEPWVTKACDVTREVAGTENRTFAEHCTGLGVIRLMQRRHSEAIALLEQGLAVRRAVLPSDDPNIAQSIEYLAVVYDETGRSDEAIELAQRALDWWQRTLPADHPRLASGAKNLAIALGNAGRHGAAVPHFEEAVRVEERVLPKDHHDLLRSRLNLAGALIEIGDFARAVPIVDAVLAALDPSRHPAGLEGLARYLRGLGHERAGRLDEAAADFDEALRIAARSPAQTAMDVGLVEARRAALHERRGAPGEAIKLLVARVRRLRRGSQAELDAAVDDLAALYRRLGRERDASRLERRFPKKSRKK